MSYLWELITTEFDTALASWSAICDSKPLMGYVQIKWVPYKDDSVLCRYCANNNLLAQQYYCFFEIGTNTTDMAFDF